LGLGLDLGLDRTWVLTGLWGGFGWLGRTPTASIFVRKAITKHLMSFPSFVHAVTPGSTWGQGRSTSLEY